MERKAKPVSRHAGAGALNLSVGVFLDIEDRSFTDSQRLTGKQRKRSLKSRNDRSNQWMVAS